MYKMFTDLKISCQTINYSLLACHRFCGISCECPVLMERVLKNADISVLSNFLAIFFEFFSPYREILQSTICMPNFRSTGPSKQKLQMGGRICPLPTIPICKKPGLFRVNSFLQDDASASIQSLQTSIKIKLCQNLWNGLYRHIF